MGEENDNSMVEAGMVMAVGEICNNMEGEVMGMVEVVTYSSMVENNNGQVEVVTCTCKLVLEEEVTCTRK